MKSKIFNQDGTIKLKNLIIFVVAILSFALLLIYLLFFKDQNITKNAKQITSANTTTKIQDKCVNCSLEFTNDSFELEANSEYYLSDMVELKNIVVNSVNFSVDDSTLVTIQNDSEGKLVFKTKDKVGTTILTAKFDTIEVKTKIVIKAGEIVFAKLLDHPYYIYLDSPVKIELNTNPSGLDTTYFEVYIEDESIAKLNDDGTVTGLSVGETKIHLKFNEEEFVQKIYVLSSNIEIQCKLKTSYEECYNIDYNDIKDNTVDFLVTIDGKYTTDDLKYQISDDGINGNIAYDGVELGMNNTYHYKLTLTRGDGDGSKMNAIFSLPDGTSKTVTIYYNAEE